MKDWVGDKNSIFKTLGATNHTDKEREENDYYATNPIAIDALLNDGGVKLSPKVWEPACGQGHLSERLKQYGYEVYSTDLIYRGYGTGGVDFLKYRGNWDGDIITNPPYKNSLPFVEHALDVVLESGRVFMFLKLSFLEGKARRKLFDIGCLKTVYVSSSRILCGKNGEFDHMGAGKQSAVAYAWFVWEKGFKGDPIIKWIN